MNAKVEQWHRDMVEAWCRERGWLCPPEGAEQFAANAEQRGREDEREQCLKAAEGSWKRAHTYASENAALYRAGDHAADTVIAAIRARGQRKEVMP